MQHPSEPKVVATARQYLLMSLQANEAFCVQQTIPGNRTGCLSRDGGSHAGTAGIIARPVQRRILKSTQWQLGAQAHFYANREHWLSTATEICLLVDSCRNRCTFSERGVKFHDAENLATFDALMARIDNVRYQELQDHALHMQRLHSALLALGHHTSA